LKRALPGLLLVFFEPHAVSGSSPECVPKRTSATTLRHGFTPKLPDGQITSDYQKPCQAPFAKIFRFAPGPNQFTDSHCLVPARGADRASSRNAGRDAVDAAASGEQQRAGRMMPKRTAKSCRS